MPCADGSSQPYSSAAVRRFGGEASAALTSFPLCPRLHAEGHAAEAWDACQDSAQSVPERLNRRRAAGSLVRRRAGACRVRFDGNSGKAGRAK